MCREDLPPSHRDYFFYISVHVVRSAPFQRSSKKGKKHRHSSAPCFRKPLALNVLTYSTSLDMWGLQWTTAAQKKCLCLLSLSGQGVFVDVCRGLAAGCWLLIPGNRQRLPIITKVTLTRWHMSAMLMETVQGHRIPPRRRQSSHQALLHCVCQGCDLSL